MKLYDWLWSIFHPSFWIMNDKYSKEWDQRLNQLMSEHKFIYKDVYTAKLGPYIIWTSNYPYAAFHPYEPKQMRIRPSRRTIKRAWGKLQEDLLND